jgi:hypothetical protein
VVQALPADERQKFPIPFRQAAEGYCDLVHVTVEPLQEGFPVDWRPTAFADS